MIIINEFYLIILIFTNEYEKKSNNHFKCKKKY